MAAARQGHRAVARAWRGDIRLQHVLQARFLHGEGQQARANGLDPPCPGGAADPGFGGARRERPRLRQGRRRRGACARPEKDASQPWENPGTGARGTVTPIADAYTQDGFQCRDFLASYIREGAESWLQGGACRIHQGKWTVRTLRPLKRS